MLDCDLGGVAHVRAALIRNCSLTFSKVCAVHSVCASQRFVVGARVIASVRLQQILLRNGVDVGTFTSDISVLCQIIEIHQRVGGATQPLSHRGFLEPRNF
jgi:hypothetical protein